MSSKGYPGRSHRSICAVVYVPAVVVTFHHLLHCYVMRVGVLCVKSSFILKYLNMVGGSCSAAEEFGSDI